MKSFLFSLLVLSTNIFADTRLPTISCLSLDTPENPYHQFKVSITGEGPSASLAASWIKRVGRYGHIENPVFTTPGFLSYSRGEFRFEIDRSISGQNGMDIQIVFKAPSNGYGKSYDAEYTERRGNDFRVIPMKCKLIYPVI